MANQYPVAQSLQQMTSLLNISPERVLRRVGLSHSLSQTPDLRVDAATYFRLWESVTAEADRPGMEMELAMAYAHGPFLPPIFAFSCAETLALGLARLADFKPLIGPVAMDVSRPQGKLHVDIRASEPGLAIPASMGLFEILYITECTRCFTGTPVTPLKTTLPGPVALSDACTDFLGHAPQTTDRLSLTFAAEDAERPLITRSKALWETLEPGFLSDLEDQQGTATMAGRIKKTLADTLPGGSATIEDMARRLNVSKRSLQRRLSEEGTNFQAVLSETRLEMSEIYLKDNSLSVPEISYLLGFRDTSSFFRAFHGWTGTTPGDYRTQAPEPRLH